jgi:hypothetical protein
MGRSAADKRRQDQRQEHIRRLAADLGVPDPSMADRLMLMQAVDLSDWRPVDLEQAMRRADTVRRLIENVEHRHGGNGTPRRVPRQAPETAAEADGHTVRTSRARPRVTPHERGLQGHPRPLASRPLRVRG